MIDSQIADVEGAGAIRSGVVSDIQRCSVHDGPGIRTTMFLKGCPLLVRIPVVPGFNDDKASLESLLEFTAQLTDQVAYIAYHRLATGNYRRLGREYPMARTAEPTLVRGEGPRACIGTGNRSALPAHPRLRRGHSTESDGPPPLVGLSPGLCGLVVNCRLR
jgi:hypothetical protein